LVSATFSLAVDWLDTTLKSWNSQRTVGRTVVCAAELLVSHIHEIGKQDNEQQFGKFYSTRRTMKLKMCCWKRFCSEDTEANLLYRSLAQAPLACKDKQLSC